MLEASQDRKKTLGDLCPYSRLSLKLYLTLPVFKISILLGLSNFPSCLMVVTLSFLIDYIFKFALNIKAIASCITIVKHEKVSDHPHDRRTTNSVIAISLLLSFIFLFGVILITNNIHNHNNSTTSIHNSTSFLIGIYLVLLSLFHFSEYFVTSLTNPSTLSPSSFLIGQSAYSQAITCSVLEYLIESYFFPTMKHFNYISLIGLIMALGGEIVRKCAMFTAGKNFSHLIKSTKDPEHKLITHGIYKLLRHPSYAGWYYWAIGSQLLLLNPICTIVFAVISNCFFYDRIQYEEELLIEFFGQDYKDYIKRAHLWVPLWDMNPYLIYLERKLQAIHRRFQRVSSH